MPKSRSASAALLDRAAALSTEAYNPGLVIDAVNALQPLGKEQALAQIDACLASAGKKKPVQGLFWVLRALFDMPTGREFPPVLIGQPTIPPPADARKLPRFPIVMAQSVPFLAVDKYLLGGKAEPVDTHVAYYRTHGLLRAQPLAPPASLEGVEQAFVQGWRAAYGEAHLQQALKAVSAQIDRMRGGA
jgi:hypothetical protein